MECLTASSGTVAHGKEALTRVEALVQDVMAFTRKLSSKREYLGGQIYISVALHFYSNAEYSDCKSSLQLQIPPHIQVITFHPSSPTYWHGTQHLLANAS